MLNKEFETSSGISPKLFVSGREVIWSFSPDNKKSDNEPDYQLGEKGLEELRRQLEDKSDLSENAIFSAEDKRSSLKKEGKPNQWEPFNLEPNPNQRFVNLYGGPYSQQMELNRANADKLLEVAAIQGKVVLTDVPMDSSRSIAGVNSDGSVTKRRGLFWGEKLEEDESKVIVKPIPEGWKIEIPGQNMLDELSRQESRTPLDKRFTGRFNQIVRDSLREIVFREKLTAEKDKYIRFKIINSPAAYLCSFGMLKLSDLMAPPDSVAAKIGEAPNYIFIPSGIALGLMIQGLLHVSTKRRIYHPEENRTLAEPYEYFMPYVEIDRYARGISFIKNKGRNLVRLHPQ